MSETVAAISTPMGNGGISVIRISGDNAISVADKCFSSVSGKKLCTLKGYSAAFGSIINGSEKIDDAVALVFKAPKSFTGEDTVEFSVHGGKFVSLLALEAVFAAGAKPAGAGEFTKRAFLNGKLDMVKAEAVMDIISAEGKQALRASLSAHDGALSKKSEEIKNELLYAAAIITAFTDFPDEDEDFSGINKLSDILQASLEKINALIASYSSGKILKEGVRTAIVGSPNVGKSTLMNLLVGSERSIVTDVAGTTRDVIEDSVTLGDVKLILADTAGIHQTDDTVEKIGVTQAKKRLETADLILAVFDSSVPLCDDDKALLDSIKQNNAIIILNKSDLTPCLSKNDFSEINLPIVSISAKSEEGLLTLTDTIIETVGLKGLDPTSAIIFNQRQKRCVENAAQSLIEAINTLNSGYTYDAVGVCIDNSLAHLMELTGDRVTTAVCDEVFSRFCVGK